MAFDMEPDESIYENEINDEFRHVIQNNAVANRGYNMAKDLRLGEEDCLRCAVIALAKMNDRAMAVITDAIIHGMPMTKEVADVRKEIVGVNVHKKAKVKP